MTTPTSRQPSTRTTDLPRLADAVARSVGSCRTGCSELEHLRAQKNAVGTDASYAYSAGSGSKLATEVLREGRVVTWRDCRGRLTVGFSLFCRGPCWPSFGVSARAPEVPDGHHDPVPRYRPRHARVHQHRGAGISRVPGR